MDLLNAYASLRRDGVDCSLVLAGAGAQAEQLKAKVAGDAIPDVHFPGFINQTELPAVYGACEVFSLPSDNEPWGLAINEAMAAGLPIVAVDEIGCVDDLVEDGVNGGLHRAGDVAGLARALQPLLTDESHRARASAASRARISRWGYAECAAALHDMLDRVAKRRP
jgi:glycosyltransferase involved in cell wall biosynthesis